jgi:hypothetical protein
MAFNTQIKASELIKQFMSFHFGHRGSENRTSVQFCIKRSVLLS